MVPHICKVDIESGNDFSLYNSFHLFHGSRCFDLNIISLFTSSLSWVMMASIHGNPVVAFAHLAKASWLLSQGIWKWHLSPSAEWKSKGAPVERALNRQNWCQCHHLDTDGVSCHLVKVRVLRCRAVEEFPPEKLSVERERGLALLYLPEERGGLSKVSCSQVPRPNI